MEKSTADDLPQSAFECGVCLSIVCDPISISCGHTFCRHCLARSLEQSGKRCPICRAVCHVTAGTADENKMIANLVRTLYPELYAARLLEVAEEKSNMTSRYPIFYYNNIMFPSETLSLRLFEPRYRLMMQRILNTSREFAYVPNFTNYTASVGDVVLVAKLIDVNETLDGCYTLRAKFHGRKQITQHSIEEGTMGLHYCELNDYNDCKIESAEDQSLLHDLLGRAGACLRLIQSRADLRNAIASRLGIMPPPTSQEEITLWLASVVSLFGLSDERKQECYETRSTIRRMQILIVDLEDICGIE